MSLLLDACEASAAVDLSRNPLPHQRLLDWLGPTPMGPETSALPPVVAWSREAWQAFLKAELVEFGAWDIAPRRAAP